MTAPRDRYARWQTLPEPRRQRVLDWCEDVEALQSLIELRLGLRPRSRLFGFSPFNVIVLNAWKIDGPWIPPGRLDLAGEYMEARLGGVGAGSAHGDPLAGISVPTSDATPEELELALDIRAMLGAPAPEPDEEPVAHRSRGRAHPLGAVKNQTGAR